MNDKTKKKHGNVNALQHGLYVNPRQFLLPWDSQRDFERLHADLIAELSPHGRAENEAVLELAMLHHQKHTVWRMRQSAVLRDPFTQAIRETKAKSWRKIGKRLSAAAKDMRTLQGMAEAGIAKLESQVQRLERKIAKASNREEVKLLEDKIAASRRLIAEHGVSLVQTLNAGSHAEQAFDKAYGPECMEKMVQLEAAMDARMAKVLGRLVGLKEFKRTPAGGATPSLEHA